MLRTRSKSVWLSAPTDAGWCHELATLIDRAIHAAGADRDVVNVAVTAVAATGQFGSSPTVGVIVTVVWREVGEPVV